MEYQKLIKSEFENFVNKTFPKEEVRRFLLGHERLPLLIKNLTAELSKSENKVLMMNYDLHQKREIVKGLAKDFSRMFCKAALDEMGRELNEKLLGLTNGQKENYEESDEKKRSSIEI